MRTADQFEGAVPESAARRVFRAQMEVLFDGEILYNPVFCGPMPSMHVVSEEVHAAALRRRLPVFVGGGSDDGVPAVWLMDEDRANELLAVAAGPTMAVQWVICGRSNAAAAPDRVAAWLAKGGFTIRAPAFAGGSGWSVEGATHDALAAAAERPSFAVVVAPRALLPAVAAELLLHFELNGATHPVRVAPSETPAWLRKPAGASTPVLTIRAEDVAAVDPSALLTALSCGTMAGGIVFDPEAFASASSNRAWVSIFDSAFVVQRSTNGRSELPSGVAPALEDVLVGASAPRPVTAAMTVHLAVMSLGQVLQAAESWESPADLVVFSPEHFGTIVVAGGRIASVELHPGHEVSEPDILRGLTGIASWRDASVILVPRADATSSIGGVAVSNAVFALAMGSDSGTLPSDEVPAMRAYDVAQRLVDRGLPAAAVSLLERSERASGWGAEEDALLGRLVAGRDPQTAAVRLRHAAVRAMDGSPGVPADLALYVGSTLNALLIEVRGGGQVPASAWAIVSEWLERAGTAWVLSDQHAAIWMELAFRAGALDSAREAQRMLRDIAPDRRCWQGLLDLDMKREGRVDCA